MRKIDTGVFPMEILSKACITDLYDLISWKSSISTDFQYMDKCEDRK